MTKIKICQKIMKAYKFSKRFMHLHTNRPYHNFRHARDVAYIANKLAKLEGYTVDSRYLLVTAALMHDLIVEPGGKYNEEISVGIMEVVLPNFGYTKNEIKIVSNLIKATKLPTQPQNELEKIICDADIDNLGRKDFFERGKEVRVELGLPKNNRWYQKQLQFLKEHAYYTKIARKLRDSGKATNIQKLEKMLQEAKC